jgi:hypothetical protein
VHVRKPNRPTPAFALAAIALFVSLGGTGYAATTLTAGPSDHAQAAATKSKTLTKAQVNKLIGAYIANHHLSVRGPAGPAGPAGGAGPTGGTGGTGPTGGQRPAGPGAVRIAASGSSAVATPQPAGTASSWTFSLTCNGGGATFTVHGPGNIGATTSLAGGGSAATTYVGGMGAIGAGSNAGIGPGVQMSQTGYLVDGSTMYQFTMLMTAVNGGPFNNCTLTGTAIPVS